MLLRKKLRLEKSRRLSLATKLKRTQSDKRRLEEVLETGVDSFDLMRKHSTMKEDNQKDDSTLVSSMNNLSFATMNIGECKPVSGEEEIGKQSFEHWIELLDASLELAGVENEQTKMRFFRVKAGPQLLDILDGTKSSENCPDSVLAPYSHAVERLRNFFCSRQYTMTHRQKLRSLFQASGESDLNYVKRVVSAAKMCDYKDEVLVENVGEVLQLHAHDIKIRDIGRKVLQKGGSISDLIDKVRAREIAKANEEVFARTHAHDVANVAALSFSRKPKFQGQQGRNRPNVYAQKAGSSKLNQADWRGNRNRNFRQRVEFNRRSEKLPVPCWRCTGNFHGPDNCFAEFKECNKCGEEGHIARACQKTTESRPVKRRIPEEDVPKKKRILAIGLEDGNMDEKKSVSSTDMP